MATTFTGSQPLDFFLWGYLKERIYSPLPANTEDLKAVIRTEIRKISRETCRNVISNLKHRVDVITAQKGRHVEHLL